MFTSASSNVFLFCLAGAFHACYSVFRKIHVFVFSALLRRRSLVVILAGRVSLGSENKNPEISTVVEFCFQRITAADFLTHV